MRGPDARYHATYCTECGELLGDVAFLDDTVKSQQRAYCPKHGSMLKTKLIRVFDGNYRKESNNDNF